MIDKRVKDMAALIADCPDLKDGAIILLGGFGDAGVAERLVEAICPLGLRNLTVVSNGAGGGDYGLGRLIKEGCVSKLVSTFPRSSDSKIFEDLYAAGEIELETVPQGTMAERIRAGGAGIPAFYTATAYGTLLAEGKETREFEGRQYVMERGIKADVALVHAAAGDRWGNLTYSKTARNFNPVMATAASTTLVEVRQFVDMIPPEEVITPGIFVDRMVEVGELT
jgi:3-oxoadipate CoA-transferase, alpha subunit